MEGFFGLNSPLLWKFQFKFNPPSLEFPMTLSGGGMDIFCNHTMVLNSIHLAPVPGKPIKLSPD